MKRSLTVILLFSVLFPSIILAQDFPPEWIKYTMGNYLYDIQSAHINRNQSETELKDYLTNNARLNLARQITTKVQDYSQLNKEAINGRSTIKYKSTSSFATDLEIKLVETKSYFDKSTGEGFAIAFIEKETGSRYYDNEISTLYSKISNSINLSKNYLSSGYKRKAQEELESCNTLMEKVDNSILWLNIFGVNSDLFNKWQDKFAGVSNEIKTMAAQLNHGVKIYLICHADIFGSSYSKLQNELKGLIASEGCEFVDRPTDSDWIIDINCNAREYSNVEIGRTETYITYVDAEIKIKNNRTSQCILEDEVTVKGGHTFGYKEAAKSAYKEIKQQLAQIIKDNISQ